ncbi:MAG: VOC family protein [Acidobacteria bacterium]|nr:VOC family protein [Acidobacteriota bacterium]
MDDQRGGNQKWNSVGVQLVFLVTVMASLRLVLGGAPGAEPVSVSEIKSAVISVQAMDRSVKFYTDVLGFEKVVDVDLSGPKIEKLWELKPGTRARMVLLRRDGVNAGMIRLVQFTPGSSRFIRQGAKSWDVGIFDLDFIVDDINRRYEELKAQGYQFPASPGEVKTTGQTMFALFRGPDRVTMVLLRTSTGPFKPGEKLPKYSEAVTSLQVVADVEKALMFYRDILGLKVRADYMASDKQLDAMLGLPSGSRLRGIVLTGGESLTGKVELIHYPDLKGREVGDAKPPNIGLFMLSFAVDDVDRLFEAFRKNNVSVICPPTEMEFAPYGKTKVMTARSPNGVMLEFVQAEMGRLDDQTSQAGPSGNVERGKTIFQAQCSLCHKVTEERSVGPGLKGVLQQPTFSSTGEAATEENLKKLILQGTPGMPKIPLAEEEVRDLLAYLKTL